MLFDEFLQFGYELELSRKCLGFVTTPVARKQEPYVIDIELAFVVKYHRFFSFFFFVHSPLRILKKKQIFTFISFQILMFYKQFASAVKRN